MITALLLLPSLALAQVPSSLAYQGRLYGSDGLPVAGQVSIKFSLFDAATVGSEVWSETQTVGLSDGFYATYLGQSTPLGDVFDGRTLFLELSVNGAALTPRQRIASVPYALSCKSVAGGATTERGGLFTDVARGRKATVSAGSIKNSGPTGEAPDSYWTTSTFASSMTVDLGQLVTGIFEVAFESYPRGAAENIPAYQGSGLYQLEYSEDTSKPWTPVPAVAPVSGDFFDHKLKSVQARYIRLTVSAPALPGKPVNISMFRVLSFAPGENTAIDARRLYNGPASLDNGETQIKLGFANRTLWGSNSGGNLHLDADKTKTGGLIYLNWYDGKGVVFGNGSASAVASVDSAGNVNTIGSFSQNGIAFKGVVAGGTCMNGILGLWDPQQPTYGGATCDNYKAGYVSVTSCPAASGNVAQVKCPANTTKITVSAMSNCNVGGEGAICVR